MPSEYAPRNKGFCSFQEEEPITRQSKCFNTAAALVLSFLLVAFAAIHSIPETKKATRFVTINDTLSEASRLHSNNSSPETPLPPWMNAFEEFQNSRIVKKSDGTLQYTNEPYLCGLVE